MKLHRVNSSGLRVDVYLFDLIPDLTRSKIQSLIKLQQILIDDKPTKPSYVLKGNEKVSYSLDSLSTTTLNTIKAEDMKLNIIHEDNDIIVINKDPGIVVHPGAGNYSGTILNGIIDKIDQTNFNSTPGIVHRLDKETSGVMIIAKNFKAHTLISKQFEERKVKKIYKALVWGKCEDKGVIEGNIIRNKKNRKLFILSNSKKGRFSKTEFRLIDSFGPISYLELKPQTGRTHQIRVHMKSIGHPILSDTAYSGGTKMIKSFHVKYIKFLKEVLYIIKRVALHAELIEFIHPSTNKKVKFKTKIPSDLQKVINLTKKHESL